MIEEQKTITTPVRGIEVVLKTYLTGREFEYVQSPLLQAMSIRPEGQGNNMKFGNLDVDKIQESTHRLIEKHVISVGGKTEDAVNLVLDMHNDDYQFVVEQIQELSKKN